MRYFYTGKGIKESDHELRLLEELSDKDIRLNDNLIVLLVKAITRIEKMLIKKDLEEREIYEASEIKGIELLNGEKEQSKKQ